MTKRWTGLIVVLWVCLLAVRPMAGHAHDGGHAELAARLLPSVVSIVTETEVSTRSTSDRRVNPFEGTPLEDYYWRFFGSPNPDQQDSNPRSMPLAQGSGFIISGDGDIITNVHVINRATRIIVRLDDGTEHEATVVATDPKTDIALLGIDAPEDLPTVTFGDSDDVRIGDLALAIGNPFGFGNSVTAGIISARQRDIRAGPYDQFLQTDAPINRGNSGGPLFNSDGEVIGVNTLIYTPSGGSVGIGFAVPSNLVVHVVSQLREFGRTRRGWLGVRIQEVTPEIAEGLGLPAARGALVSSVTPDSPAEKAGLLVGDTVVRFDGVEIGEMRELPRLVAEAAVGRDVEVAVIRDGEEVVINVRLGELEAYEAGDDEAPHPDGEAQGEGDVLLGMELRTLDADLARELGLGEDAGGVLVTGVEPDGPASRAGIEAGDILLNAGRVEVRTVGDFARLLDEARAREARSMVVRIRRGEDAMYVALALGE